MKNAIIANTMFFSLNFSFQKFKKKATFGEPEQIKVWESRLHKSIELKFEAYCDINNGMIEEEESKAQENRRMILRYATTALSVVGVAAGAAAGAAAATGVSLMRR